MLSGKPFGAHKSVYVGGACFERDDANGNALLVVVEIDNIWSLRRYVRTGAAYPTGTPGTWALDSVLYTAPAGSKLGRPVIPQGAENLPPGNRVVVVSVYPFYSIKNFTDWVSKQKGLKY